MRPENYDEVYAVWEASPGVGLSRSDSREGISRLLQRNPGCCFVARTGEQIVGAVLCGHDGRRGFITHLAVVPSHRRQGIGRTLVDRCLAALRELGIRKCSLVVFRKNEEAQRFWKSIGWFERDELQMMSKWVIGEDAAGPVG
jgi:ribosomal protein S18 acetylase RimI-like enzyme